MMVLPSPLHTVDILMLILTIYFVDLVLQIWPTLAITVLDALQQQKNMVQTSFSTAVNVYWRSPMVYQYLPILFKINFNMMVNSKHMHAPNFNILAYF